MKIFTIPFFLFIIISCNQIKDKGGEKINKTGIFYPEVKKHSIIKGKIININNYPNQSKTIRLYVDDIVLNEQTKYVTKIDNNGNFLFDIPLNNPTEVYINYSDGKISPYIFPNDSLTLNCKILSQNSKIGISVSSYDKKHNSFQKQFYLKHKWFVKQTQKCNKNLPKERTPEDLKNYYLKFKEKNLEKINNLFKQEKNHDTLNDFLKNSITYFSYKKIISCGKNIKNIDERNNFYSFLNDSIVFNKNALNCSSYSSFINWYTHIVERDTTFTAKGKTKEIRRNDYVSQRINYRQNFRTDIWKEYVIAYIINTSVVKRNEEFTNISIPFYFNLIDKYINDNYTYQVLTSKVKEMEILINERGDINISDKNKIEKIELSDNEFFDNILEKNKGKVIYLDFWATWCSPCIQQMSYSRELHSKFKNKKVSFIYLACKSEKHAVENIISREKLKGINYILTQKQYEFFEKKFNLNGFPQYVLIDKYGTTYSNDASKPQYKKAENTINTLLLN
ncbi:TlpA disulfide reductase family protein [Wenyingzhuangia sp. 2_MG-2023]|uniref:TlpA family protein disulfide reductase n=1 Tax=Wenyingzhuangia sp. 2_MG-2023 TaxID=3062639 RepID=UPI0026E1C26E|nr:TlpA disulfide reductase family protein [Wenyingzhuangia sp. 2_MG-2023]MDO6739450.1 TlpA disulfide reductase family protein [Wenyingzhuangia sp. 2_MG-2023]